MHTVLKSVAGCLLAALALPAVARAQVPPRTFAGQTLEVPEEHLDLGMIYYVEPGIDTQVVMTSQTPLQRVAATTSRVVGYVVVPFDLEEGQSPIVAGAFRLPVSALRTEDDADRLLKGPAFLDAAKHPEIALRILRLDEVKVTDRQEGQTSYEGQLHAEATVKGSSAEVSMPVLIRLTPSSFGTFARNMGDMLTIQGSLSVDFAQHGWQPPRGLAPRIATKIPIDIFLMLNTISPDKSGDPRIAPGEYDKTTRLTTLLRDLDDPVEGYKHGRLLMKERWQDAGDLAQLSRIVTDTRGIEHRDLAFALQTAQRAAELSKEGDPAVTSQLARVHFLMGQAEKAIAVLEAALEKAGEGRAAALMKRDLERYRALADVHK